MKVLLSLLVVTACNAVCFSQNNAAQTIARNKTLEERAAKIIAPLNLKDSAKYNRVLDVIVGQYEALSIIHDGKERQLSELKTETDKAVHEARRKSIDDAAANRLTVQHTEYLAKLGKDLNGEQVTVVKDGMTYNVLHVTVKAYNDMIPTLKPAEKEKIVTWLTEARELAMDAGSSDAKHAVFGKYKGRINNYLSAQGYDLQKERKQWEERQKEARK